MGNGAEKERLQADFSKYTLGDYDPGRNFFVRAMWFLTNAIFIRGYWNPSSGLRRFLLKLYGAKIGKGVVIKPGVNIKFPWYLEVGDQSWIGENVWIDNLVPVRIGSNCCLSQGSMLLTGNHNYKLTHFPAFFGEIILEDGAWVGAKAMVAPGVTLKSHSVLSIMSVATHDLEPYTIYSGHPAQAIRKREIEA